jgi:hypothetical protein
MNLEEKKVYYENFKHFKTEMRKLLINSAHRNGIFVIRLTLSIGAFNALINYVNSLLYLATTSSPEIYRIIRVWKP